MKKIRKGSVYFASSFALILGLNFTFSHSEDAFAAEECLVSGDIRLEKWGDLVDSGKHLDWTGSTKYSDYFYTGIAQWNGYKPGVIRKDSWNTLSDVLIQDVNIVNGNLGNTDSDGGIAFNKYYLDGNYKSNAYRYTTTTHELGHALGMCHQRLRGQLLCMRSHMKCTK